jgi:hypothetical protein
MLGRYYHPGDEAGKPSGESFEVDWDAAYPIKPNLELSELPEGSELRAAAVNFSREYQTFLARLTEALSGKPELLVPVVGDMFRIRELAAQLMRNPLPDRSGLNAAPIYLPIEGA